MWGLLGTGSECDLVTDGDPAGTQQTAHRTGTTPEGHPCAIADDVIEKLAWRSDTNDLKFNRPDGEPITRP